MFTQLTPILAADDHHGVNVDAVLARLGALQMVLTTLARIAGRTSGSPVASLASRADLAAALSCLRSDLARRVATECDAISQAMTAGLVALERARQTGVPSKAAAGLLHDECSAALANVRESILLHP